MPMEAGFGADVRGICTTTFNTEEHRPSTQPPTHISDWIQPGSLSNICAIDGILSSTHAMHLVQLLLMLFFLPSLTYHDVFIIVHMLSQV